jgi:hypothetical protein
VESVALSAAYGVQEGAYQVPVAAVVLRDVCNIDGPAVYAALRAAPNVTLLPRYVRHVDRIPLTDGYRPIKDALRSEPIGPDGRTWRVEPARETYELL